MTSLLKFYQIFKEKIIWTLYKLCQKKKKQYENMFKVMTY